MLKHGEINPLNVHVLRRMEECPLHFTAIDFELRTSEKHITDWVYENLAGRFWIGDYFSINDAGSITATKRISFEIGAEASYFGMFLDQINTNNSNVIF